MIVKHHNLRKKLHELWAHRATAVFMMAAMVVVSAAATDWANALYILTGTEDSAIILDESSDVPDISSQLVYVTSGSSGHDVTLTAGQTVTSPRRRRSPPFWIGCTFSPVLWTWWVWT